MCLNVSKTAETPFKGFCTPSVTAPPCHLPQEGGPSGTSRTQNKTPALDFCASAGYNRSGERNAVTTAAGFSQLVMVYMYYKPSLGRVAVCAFFHYNGNGKRSNVKCNTHRLHLLSEVISQPPAFWHRHSVSTPSGAATLYQYLQHVSTKPRIVAAFLR